MRDWAMVHGLAARLAAAVSVVILLSAAVIGFQASAARASGLSGVTDYSVPGGDPWGTAFDSSGRVWVAMPGCDPSPSCSGSTPPGKLALFDPATSSFVTVVSLPAGYGQPLFVAVDKAGNIWFTMPVTNTIGEYNPTTTTVMQWAVPTASAGPWDLAIDSTGKIWFTEHYVNKISSFDPASHAFHEVATPATNSNPYGIAIDSASNVWFTENNDAVALIGEYTAAGTLLEYKIRNSATAGTGLTPHKIVVAPNGSIWWSEGFVSAIASLTLASAQPGTNNGVTEDFYIPACSSCGSHTSGISADALGNIWWDDSLQNTFGSYPVGGGSFSTYSSPSGGHPHDGLNVDSQNRIWFDEEFAGKLAEATQSGGPSPSPSPTTTGGTVLGTDTFQRANRALWGTSSGGQAWAGDANTAAAFSISGNTGLVTNTGGTSYSAVLGASAANEEAYATGSLSSFAGGNWGAVLRWTDGNDWYKAYIDGQNLVIQKKVAGSAATLATVPFMATAGTSYTIHFRAVGTALSVNAWPSSGTEPAGSMLTATDSSLGSGFAGIRFLTQTGTATITAFLADTPGSGSPSPSPSATTTSPSPSPSATTTSPSPTPSPTTTTGTALGTDTFQRANRALWGTSSGGQAWAGDANTAAAFSISGNAGLVTNTGGTSYSAVLGASSANEEAYTTGSLSSFSGGNWGDVLRWTDGNDWYKAYIDGQNLVIQKKVAGSAATLATTAFAAAAGTSYTIHFRAVGTALSVNVWPSSGTEPAGSMLTATDSSLGSGFAGIRFLTQTATATITAFLADTPGSGSPSPSPSATTTSPSPSPSATTTSPSPSPSPTTSTSTGTSLGTDTFHRASQALWGTSSGGQAWAGDANTSTVFSVSGNAGLVSGTGGTSYSAVLGASSANEEAYATGSLSSFSSSNWGDVLRWTDGNDWYKAYIDGQNLVIQKKVAGSAATLATVPFTATAGTSYTIHFRAVGTALSVNAWPSSGTEPAGSMLTATDSSLGSGFAGMRFLTQTGTATVTAFQANAL